MAALEATADAPATGRLSCRVASSGTQTFWQTRIETAAFSVAGLPTGEVLGAVTGTGSHTSPS